MERDIKCLETIIRHCDNIDETIKLFGSDEEDFISNIPFQQSCAFSMMQIGEMAKRLSSELTSAYSDIEWRDIAKYRDFLSHHYERVNLHSMWYTIETEVPVLKERCNSILSDLK